MSEKKTLRNVGLNLTFTGSRKKSVIGKSLSSGEFPQGTVSTSRSFGMLTQGRMFATCPREYIVNPKEFCHETKEYLRALFYLDKLPSAKRICIERIMQKMIVPDNEHIFLDTTSLPHLYLAELTSKTLQELNEELNNRGRLSDFKKQQGHTRNSRLLKDDTVSALVSFLKEKFQSLDKQASYRTGIPDSVTQTHAGSNCNYPDSLFLPKKTRTFTFPYWPSGYCARHNPQTDICGLQNTLFHLTLFPASQQPTVTLYVIPASEMRISPLPLAQSGTTVLRFSVR